MKDEFLALFKKYLEITGGSKMETFLGVVAEQDDKCIKIHLDHYVKEVIAVYSGYIKKSLRTKKVPMSPGVAFKAEDVPKLPHPTKQKHYHSLVAMLQFAASWIQFNISFTVSQLARFRASAGRAQWAALYYLMEYLAARPNFKIKYHRGTKLMDL